MRKTSIVVGLGFGDEGKGITVASLVAESKNPLVIRFNGGQQAGHTVHHNGQQHVHSTYGAGSLHGAPTYISPFCTFDPLAGYAEYMALFRKLGTGEKPTLYVDPMCPVTLPWDVERNQSRAALNLHGSVGTGFGMTLDRNENNFKLFAMDLEYPNVWRKKVELIGRHYINTYQSSVIDVQTVIDALDEVVLGRHVPYYKILNPILDNSTAHDHYIFEGAQGIMLDQDHGYFPHCTPSYCTSRNAQELIEAMKLPDPLVYLVTRPYGTRHGNGPLINEELAEELVIRNDEHESNVRQPFQGEFRRAPLDIEQLRYAIACEDQYSHGQEKYLVMTCMDQVDELIVCTSGERLMRWIPREVVQALGFEEALMNYSAQGKWVRNSYAVDASK
jgi:adenylosuccinate synthase